MKIFLAFVLCLVSTAYSKPQFLSFSKEGGIGVNFGGYHAGVGGFGAGGKAGGLFAEAGTPFGQAARAGLGGAVDESGQSAGGLYAGATAGGNVHASTGLSGGVTAGKSAGVGYAEAQAGDHAASSGLGGESSIGGSSGFTFSGTKSFGLTKGVVKHTEVEALPPVTVVETPVKTVHKEVVVETDNELPAVPLKTKTVQTTAFVETPQPPVTIVKEVYVPQPVVEKHITHVHRVKPHHFRKTAYVGGYFGGYVPPPPPPPPTKVYYKTVQVPVHVPVVERRVDVVADSGVESEVQAGGGGHVGYTKSVTFQKNPTFFADIFNIPIQTLKAVGNFLGNAGGSANISVQKTASVHAADADVSSKHAPVSSVSSHDTKVTINTPSASKIVDDILAIPINTLGAVNKFLENNVPARKRVVTEFNAEEGPTRVRLGPKARRRANKHSVVLLEDAEHKFVEEEH